MPPTVHVPPSVELTADKAPPPETTVVAVGFTRREREGEYVVSAGDVRLLDTLGYEVFAMLERATPQPQPVTSSRTSGSATTQ